MLIKHSKPRLRWNTTVILPTGRNVKSTNFPPQKDSIYKHGTPLTPYTLKQRISLSIKRDQRISKLQKYIFFRYFLRFSGTFIFEAVRSKPIPVNGQSSDWDNKLNNYVTIFGNVSFCREFLLHHSQMKLIS